VPTTDRLGDAATGAAPPPPAPAPATGTVVPSGVTSTTAGPGSVALGEPDDPLLPLWLPDPSCQLYVLSPDCATAPLVPLPVSCVPAVFSQVSLLW